MSACARALLVLFASACWLQSAALPLKTNGNHYIVDQNGAPFFIQGDSPWFLINQVTGANIETYLSTRQAHGFNTLILGLTLSAADGAAANTNLFGRLPFTSNAGGFTNLTSWNEHWFTNVDYVLNRAAHYGFVVLAYPFYDGFGGATGYEQLTQNTTNDAHAFGAFIGNRYKNQTNLVWVGGGDYSEPHPHHWNWIAAGIRSQDTNHLFTAQAARPTPATYYTNFVTLNSTYVSEFTYVESLAAYQRTPVLASFSREPYYETRTPPAMGVEVGAQHMRQFAWWSVLHGDAGHVYGHESLYNFNSGWQDLLTSPGASVTNVGIFMQSLAWWKLVPDAAHGFVTAGYGTSGTTNYATAAWAQDGSLGMVYLPTTNAITVDMRRFGGSVTSRWFDVTSGQFTAVSGSPFANVDSRNFAHPGSNDDGANDWVLLLESPLATASTLATRGTITLRNRVTLR